MPDLIFYLENPIDSQFYDKKDLVDGNVFDPFKSSDKKLIYRFLMLPLRIFRKGGLFSPYTPLQQISDVKW